MHKLILTLLTISLSFASFAKMTNESVFVVDEKKSFLKLFKSHKDLSIDHLTKKGYELYGPEGLRSWLDDLGVDYLDLTEIGFEKEAFGYPSSNEIEDQLKELALKYPAILKLSSLGKSTKGNDIWSVKISDNVHQNEIEPEFKYIANMHGDEIVGRELMVLLIADLAKKYTEGDKQVTKLVNNTEIHIVPSMNPDGADARRRGNAEYTDLNRDFPDFTTRDRTNTPDGRSPETAAIMKFQAAHNFALSANFHGGTEVVNYPWDTTHEHFPLHDLVVALSKEYANDVPGMRNSREFPGGITNGYKWYEVDGGMQDWSYYWYGDLQVTVELSHRKWPNYSSVPGYYRFNQKSLIRYISRIHQGAGFYFSEPDRKGSVKISRIVNGTKTPLYETRFAGEYYKVLDTGEFFFEVETDNGDQFSFKRKVSKNGISNYISL